MQHMGRRLAAIALLALLVRAFVPAGYMLAQADTPNGRYLVVQMCQGHAQPSRVIDLDTGKEVDPSQAPADGEKQNSDPRQAPCVFAGAPALGQPVAIAEPVEFLAKWDVEFTVAQDLRPGRGIPAPPPPATGPPSLT
jgi:hypothetical protein